MIDKAMTNDNMPLKIMNKNEHNFCLDNSPLSEVILYEELILVPLNIVFSKFTFPDKLK